MCIHLLSINNLCLISIKFSLIWIKTYCQYSTTDDDAFTDEVQLAVAL